jgi:F420-0:gamma-glutamyl ligase
MCAGYTFTLERIAPTRRALKASSHATRSMCQLDAVGEHFVEVFAARHQIICYACNKRRQL